MSVLSLASLMALLFIVAQAEDFTNPIRNGADPFIVWDNVTSAYYLLTTPGNQLHISTATTLNKLKSAERIKVFQNQEMITKSTVWAPEIHKIGGTWYLYYSLDDHSYVLTGGAKPLDAYTNPLQLSADYGIDGTVLKVGAQAYYVWSCLRQLADLSIQAQSLCIAKLTTPTTIDQGKIAIISQPMQSWERYGRPVNEGPQPLYWQGETFLVYSGSYCGTAEYSLGLLNLVGQDLLDPAAWKKLPGPAFTKANGEYSTGHNGIFVSPDGSELWNVFHATKNPAGSCGTDRETFAMKVDTTNFKVNGPNFGVIQQPGTTLRGPSGEGGQASAPSGLVMSTSSSSGASAPFESSAPSIVIPSIPASKVSSSTSSLSVSSEIPAPPSSTLGLLPKWSGSSSTHGRPSERPLVGCQQTGDGPCIVVAGVAHGP